MCSAPAINLRNLPTTRFQTKVIVVAITQSQDIQELISSITDALHKKRVTTVARQINLLKP